MASLESGRVVTCDWSSAGQEQCGYLPSVEAPWWDCAAHPPPFTEFTHPGRTRRHLPRNRWWLVDSRNRPRPAPLCSTISREVARHGGRAQYRANEADQQAWESALRPKPCLLATHTPLREIVASKLMQDWSPEQVSGWLKWQFPRMRACACRTKPFIAAYSFKRAER